MGVQKSWEDALKILEEKQTQGPTNRLTVAGDGSARWIGGNGKSWAVKQYNSFVPEQDHSFDIWWSTQLVDPFAATGTAGYGSGYAFVVGFNADWSMFDSTSSAYNTFHNDPEKNLAPLISMPYKNRVTDLWTFDNAGEMLTGVGGFLDTWIPTFKTWAESLDQGKASDWSGNAAGTFRKFLSTLTLAMVNVKTDLTEPTNYVQELHSAREELGSAQLAMYNAYHAWMSERWAGALNALHDSFLEAMAGASVKWEFTYDSNSGVSKLTSAKVLSASGEDVNSQAFFDKIEKAAKTKWMSTLVTLDTASKDAFSKLDDKYTSVAGALRRGIIPPNLEMPKPSTSGTGTGGLTEQELQDKYQKQADDQQKKYQDELDKLKQSGSADGKTDPNGKTGPDGAIPGLDSTGTGTGTGGKKTVSGTTPGLPGGDPNIKLPGTSTSTTTTGTDGRSSLVDSNGNPVLDKNKQPIMVPAGSRIDKNGLVFDSSGKPVLGPDGKQLVAPKGSSVKQSDPQSGYTPDQRFNQITVPDGAKISNGQLLDANNKPLVDSNGNPYVLPKDAQIKDGVLLDGNGKPIDRTSQLVTNQEQALLDARNQYRSTTSSGYSTGTSGVSTGSGFGSGVTTGTGSGGYGGTGKNSTTTVGGSSPLLNPETGMSQKAVAGGGDPTGGDALLRETQAEAEKRAAAAAEQQATAQGSGPGQQPPMMPPMGGMGGMSPQGGPGGQARQRTTWLAEDEEAWGTENKSVSGVIGR
ncbi:hypothetical protein AB0K51_26245 [Kitasatospora sp. NPDC049285]|uniref:hypothetical protein n=1 Tax=Kitasatospora sp. NPDC049285 TaxID=3157096 RepID=UPI003440950A